MKKFLMATAIALPLLAGTAAYADHDSIRAMKDAKITLIDAIQAAEKDQGGQAVEASIDDDSFRPSYEVSVMKDGRLFDVQVDAVDGKILGSREDLDD